MRVLIRPFSTTINRLRDVMSTPHITRHSSSMSISRALKIARIPLILAAVVYLGAAAYMGIFQRDFLYRTAPGWIAPETQGIPNAEAITLSAPAGPAGEAARLSGWWVPPRNAEAPVFLYFHGNANGLDRRARRFRLMTANGAGLLAMSYRGYGGSEGKPSEAVLHADAAFIFTELGKKVAPERIVLFGESLGSGVALHLARTAKPKAVILDSPYLSILARGQASYPWLPVSWLLVDTFRSDHWIGAANAPVLIIHGSADSVVPPGDSERLAALGRQGRVIRKLYPGEPHVVPYDRGPDVDIAAFLANLLH
jgi:uncharacterized protein